MEDLLIKPYVKVVYECCIDCENDIKNQLLTNNYIEIFTKSFFCSPDFINQLRMNHTYSNLFVECSHSSKIPISNISFECIRIFSSIGFDEMDLGVEDIPVMFKFKLFNTSRRDILNTLNSKK